MQRFHEAQIRQADPAAVPPLLQPAVFKGMYTLLAGELGPGPARKVLLESFLWDPIYHHPKWHSELFSLPSEADETHYEKIFRGLAPFICLYRRLETIYGMARAQDLTGALAMPAALAFLTNTVGTTERASGLEQLREQLRDYVGDGASIASNETVSEDGTELRFRVTRCAYTEILRAYEMDQAAIMSCYADHVFFDNVRPDLYFSRDHCKGVGDSFCDHCFKIRTPDDAARDGERHGDTKSAPFDAQAIIEQWTATYRANGGAFTR